MGTQTALAKQAFRPAKIAQPVHVPLARPRATSCILVAADLCAIFTARALANAIWHWSHPAFGFANLLGFWESLGLFVVTYAALGLYAAGGLGAVEELRRAVLGAGFVCLLLTASLFFLQHTRPYSRGLLILSGSLTAAAVPLIRSAVRTRFAKRRWWGVPVIVLGAGHTATVLIERLHQHPEIGFKPLACFEMRQNLLIPFNRWTKRAMDIAGALILGLLALPVLAAAAVWIKFVSRGSVLYSQEREGEKGRGISVVKLRTMRPDAESVLTTVLSESSEIRAEWARRFKLRKDPRILPGVGKFLRKTSLDELPQLWSVLKGEMSLVGPRPFPQYHLDEFGQRFRTLRGRVKPGLTGLWQVSDRADGDLEVQETLDTYYIRNWSLWLDLYILARTVRAVLCPKGAY